mmetsp:Transcript_49762/g.158964  ORF Transcript_49762/g.158964 Transcript_49762/m.158964 type:complete len:200 (-) Transcript_49762:250-849(-)
MGVGRSEGDLKGPPHEEAPEDAAVHVPALRLADEVVLLAGAPQQHAISRGQRGHVAVKHGLREHPLLPLLARHRHVGGLARRPLRLLHLGALLGSLVELHVLGRGGRHGVDGGALARRGVPGDKVEMGAERAPLRVGDGHADLHGGAARVHHLAREHHVRLEVQGVVQGDAVHPRRHDEQWPCRRVVVVAVPVRDVPRQ